MDLLERVAILAKNTRLDESPEPEASLRELYDRVVELVGQAEEEFSVNGASERAKYLARRARGLAFALKLRVQQNGSAEEIQ